MRYDIDIDISASLRDSVTFGGVCLRGEGDYIQFRRIKLFFPFQKNIVLMSTMNSPILNSGSLRGKNEPLCISECPSCAVFELRFRTLA